MNIIIIKVGMCKWSVEITTDWPQFVVINK